MLTGKLIKDTAFAFSCSIIISMIVSDSSGRDGSDGSRGRSGDRSGSTNYISGLCCHQLPCIFIDTSHRPNGRRTTRASAQRPSHLARHRCCYNALARRPATHADHDATRPTDCAESQSQRPNAWGDNPCPLAQLYLEEPANANRLDELPSFYFNTRPINRIGCRDPTPSWRPTGARPASLATGQLMMRR